MSKFVLVFSACLLALATRAADTVTLKAGGAVEGQVIRDTPSDPLIAVNTGGKLLLLNRGEITGITLDDDGRAEFQQRRDALKDNNAAAHFELYKWAKSRRLFDYADQQLSATLKADPGHAEARKIVYAAATLSKAAAKAPAPDMQAVADDAPVIGLRPVPPAQRARNDFDAKILTYCKALFPTVATDDPARKTALAALNAERVKASETVVSYLDAAKTDDEQTRLAALAGIEVLKPVSAELSRRLAAAAMYDPSAAVRSQTIALIKARNDEWAMNNMVKTYVSTFEEDSPTSRDTRVKAAAEAALKDLNDKRVFEAMFYYATLEIRATQTSLSNFVTRQIDSYTVQQNGVNNNGLAQAQVIPLSFPIQFPELKIIKARTTIRAPCQALGALSGMDFGDDLDAWAKWLRRK